MICDECQALYEEVADRVRDAGVFGKVRRTDDKLLCKAKDIESEAYFVAYATQEHDAVFVGWQTLDRWLSESIEADLMHTGDKIEELLEEEFGELGLEVTVDVEHFRDDKKQYVFRSKLPLPTSEVLDGSAMIDRVSKALLGYQAALSELGDMKIDELE